MTVALYMRMSTDKQESSIDSQERALRAYAASRGMKVTARYADEGVSGRSAAKRPAFMRMIEDSGRGGFDAVLVFDSSRFARNLEESIVYKSALRKNGVELISATEPTPEGDGALLTDAMLGALNEMHSRKLAAAVRRGMEYKAVQGFYQVPPPFGYKKAGRETVVDEAEAGAVRTAFRRFLECGSCHDTAQELNAMGMFKRRGGLWQGRDIRRMLSNPAYMGAVFYGGGVYPGRQEAIVGRETWEAAARGLPSGAKKTRPPSSYKHWLSGLIKCAACGGTMGFLSDRGRGSFRCSRYANGACGKSGYTSAAVMEALADTALRALAEGAGGEYLPGAGVAIGRTDGQADGQADVRTNVPAGGLADGTADGQSDVPAGSDGYSGAESLRRRMKRLEERLRRHKAAYSEGVDTLEEYRENRRKYESAKAALLREAELAKAAEKAEEAGALGLLDLIGLLTDKDAGNKITSAQKSAAIRSVIREMVFDKNAGELKVYCRTLRIPDRHAAADAGAAVGGEGDQRRGRERL
ncbi:MAG: recombinase family protein [Firmicutes bacterium]|nr:recombinase family protein [Bacillota bacterium]